MRIVVGSTQPDIVTAVRGANASVLLARSTLEFEYESARASAAFLDLRDTWVKDAKDVVQRALLRHPFLKLSVIVNPLAADPHLFFAFGQMGVADIVQPHVAAQIGFWTNVEVDVLALDAVNRFERQVRPYLMAKEHPLLTVFLPNVNKASVKQLAHSWVGDSGLSSAAQRRSLWSTCQRAKLASPEDILSGLRVLFIKSILDDRSWSVEQLARYLDYGSQRAMWRSVKRRSGLSPKMLLNHDGPALFQRITRGFFLSN